MSRPRLALLLLLASTPATAQECPTLSLVAPVGSGTSGSAGVPQLVLVGQAAVDQPIPALRIEGGSPHALGQIAVGAPGVITPLPPYGASLYLGEPFTRWLVTLDAQGRSAPVGGGDGPLPASFCGLELAAQGLVLDAGATGGAAFTAGLSLRFGEGSGGTALFDGLFLSEVTLGISSAMEVGDLDGNGVADIAFPTQGANGRIDVFHQLADGGFAKRQSAGLGFFPRDLALGDLDGDGLLDAVVLGGSTGRSLGAAFGRPDGSLSPLAVLATGTDVSPPTALSLADMDADGRLDAVTLDWVVGSVGVHLGGSGGVLGAPLLQPLGIASHPASFTIADIDEDGRLDVLLLAGTPADRVAILYGLGGGLLAAPDSALTGATPASGLALADAVGDSRPDLLVTIEGGSFSADPASLRALENLGSSFAAATVLHEELNPLFTYHGVVVADLDEDGAADALVPGGAALSSGPSAPIEPVLHVLSGLGTAGSWTTAPNLVGDSTHFRTADVDADGHADLLIDAFAFGAGTSVLVQHGRGDGSLDWPAAPPELAGQPSVVGDFDEDGRTDIAMRSADGTNAVRIGLGTAEATLLPATTIPLSGYPRGIAVADLDADGHLDLAVVMDSKSLAVVLGNGDGSFAPAADLVPPAGADYGSFVAVADVTGDGLLDLVTAASVAGSPTSTSVVHVLAGLGAASFAPPVSTPLDPGLPSTRATLGDLDGDGRADLVFTGKSDGGLRFALATGAGNFGTPMLIAASYGSNHPAPPVGDVDGDGDLDVVFHDPDDIHVRIGLNDGAASFTLLPSFEYAPYPGLRLADVDGDGRLDLLGGGVSLGYGDGTFAPQDLGLVDGAPADIDGDGDLDATDFGIVWENRPH
jgi:hypothetical protein